MTREPKAGKVSLRKRIPNGGALLTAGGLLYLLLLTPCAGSQNNPQRFEASIQVGGSFFATKTRSINELVFDIQTGQTIIVPATEMRTLTKAARFFGSFRCYFREKDAIELSYSVGPNDVLHGSAPVDPSAPLLPFVDVTNASTHFASANYVRTFPFKERGNFFVTGGVGIAFFPPRGNSFSGNFGGGVDFRLNARTSLRTEYRVFLFRQPSTVAFIGVPPPKGVGYHHGPTVGLSFRF